jgi:ribonuclease HII
MILYLQKMGKSFPSLLLRTVEPSYAGWVFGIDEAGRGCLAGPVVAACVAFDWTKPEAIRALDKEVTIRDSKLMTRVQRQKAAEAIQNVAVTWGVGGVDAAIIDEINILQATFEAMRRAVGDAWDAGPLVKIGMTKGTMTAGTRYLVDGNKTVPGVDWEQEAIIDGDAKVFSIAAASILAKEHRDSLMDAFHEEDSRYGFAQHKGYGTRVHYVAIAQHGVTSLHRKTFLRNIL